MNYFGMTDFCNNFYLLSNSPQIFHKITHFSKPYIKSSTFLHSPKKNFILSNLFYNFYQIIKFFTHVQCPFHFKNCLFTFSYKLKITKHKFKIFSKLLSNNQFFTFSKNHLNFIKKFFYHHK